MSIIVVGSGLAAVGVIRSLVASGIKPTVLDIGDVLPRHLVDLRSNLAARSPAHWTRDERRTVARNEGVPGRVVPRKLVLGSDYFYSNEQMSATLDGMASPGSPPWSPARGGFSVGWGAAVLLPAPEDLVGWPFDRDEILRHARRATLGIPVSEPRDEISETFGLLAPDKEAILPLSTGQRRLLDMLRKGVSESHAARFLVGQSRLLTDADGKRVTGCRMCGNCSSGCVYGSIYTAEQDINRWIEANAIDYRSGITVFKLLETGNTVRISTTSAEGIQEFEAERIFLAAGAVNSSRILLNSSPSNLRTATLRSTGGILQLFGSISRLHLRWPSMNTQTAIFMEIRSPSASPHWAHVQIGQPNELLLRRLGMSDTDASAAKSRIIGRLAGHVVTAMLNLHSDHGPRYVMSSSPSNNGLGAVSTTYSWDQVGRNMAQQMMRHLSGVMRRSGLLRVPFARQYSAALQGFHFGSSFPMSRNPTADNDTDELGRPFGWKRIHVCDTTVLPAIPGTTVGLLTMANAHRIASAVHDNANSHAPA
jgi:choline dehydrogenase-like flavoprotein